MKEFDLPLDKIFGGIVSTEVVSKREAMALEVHNLEPVEGEEYKLHEIVIDLNADSFAWGNP